MVIGKWLGVVSRAAMAGAVGGEGNSVDPAGHTSVGDWNVVQNVYTISPPCSYIIRHCPCFGGISTI